MTIVDHPERGVAELNQRIRDEFGEQACWRATTEWFGTPILDFGPRRTYLGRRGLMAMGELRILLDDVDWVIEQKGRVILTREQDDESDGRQLDEALVGRSLQRVERAVCFWLVFSDDVVLRCRQPMDDDAGHFAIVEFRFPNGDYVGCFADGVVETESKPA